MSTHPSDLLGHDDHHEPGDGGVMFYTIIAVILCCITAVEVACLYEPLMSLPDFVKIGILLGLSVIKFAMVCAFFMHLYFDHILTTILFLIGLVLAGGTMVALYHVIPRAEHELQVIPKVKKAAEHAYLPSRPTLAQVISQDKA
jgi:cytochrome c oxidase subunit IV